FLRFFLSHSATTAIYTLSLHDALPISRSAAGVHAVLTGNDLPHTLVGRSLADIPVLCKDVVRYIGDHVAAVAAETKEQAEAALQDRKSTRLNSSHVEISYAVFCLKKKK